jgi:hypothetical protein
MAETFLLERTAAGRMGETCGRPCAPGPLERGENGCRSIPETEKERITVEWLVGERSQEIIDMNGSHADVKEIISIGEPRKLLCFCVGSGPRWASRPRTAE